MKCVATADRHARRRSAFRHLGQAKMRGYRTAYQEAHGDRSTRNSSSATNDFIERANRDKKPFFVWFNPSRMHIWTRLKPESQGKTGLGIYPDGMVEHDGQVGQVLKKLDDLGIANNTIVIYTTDNGAETFSWPDGGHHAIQGREEHQLGRRLSRAGDGALARAGAAAQPRSTRSSRPRTGPRRWSRRPASPTSRTNYCGLRRRRKELQGSPRRLRSARPARRQGPNKRREFFYWTDDGNLGWAALRRSGRRYFWSRRPTGSTCGRSR